MGSSSDVAVVMVPFPEYGHLTPLLRLSRLISSYNIPVYFATTAAKNRQLKHRLLDWKLEDYPNLHLHDLSPPPISSNTGSTDHEENDKSSCAEENNKSSCADEDLKENNKNSCGEELEENNKSSCSCADEEELKENNNSSSGAQELEVNDAMALFVSSQQLSEPLCALCRDLISSSCKRLVIIHDTFMLGPAQRVHAELTTQVETYIFHGFPALTLYSWIQLVATNKDAHLFLPLESHIPTFQNCMHPEFPVFVKMLLEPRFKSAGHIINTCRDLEGPYLDALAKQTGNPVWGLGPLNPMLVPHDEKSVKNTCIEWLDKQPKHSVIFVSFGTVTNLSPEQINELATGLERCEHKFIWVLRSKDIMGNIFATDSAPNNELPTGFEERVADRGIIAREWVPQLEILAHPSTGGYLFHSGGGSFMESITMGVPMATWPMHSDNAFNDVLITKVLKVGVVVRDWAHRDELVTSETIANALKTLMNSPEGDEIRKRATELGKAIHMSLSVGGTTHKQMESFIAHITR